MENKKVYSKEQEELIEKYCGNNMQYLKSICYPIIIKIGGISQQDYDDLYSLAQFVFLQVLNIYDKQKKCSFHTLLVSALKNRLGATYLRDRNRQKRCNVHIENGEKVFVNDVSLDQPSGQEEKGIVENLADRQDVFEDACGNLSENFQKYLKQLSKQQKQLVKLLIEGYSREEIQRILKIDNKSLNDLMEALKAYRNVSVLFEEDKNDSKEERKKNMYGRDKTKKDAYMVEVLLRMFQRGQLNKNHPLQRHAGRWQLFTKSGFVSTVIKGEDVDSIKICEQLLDNGFILWLIDGLQRLTALNEFKKGAFKISKNLEMPFVYYQTIVDDKLQVVEYDLRGKNYDSLPDELKDSFNSYPIEIVKHLDCTEEEIAYHIARYNRQTSMNAEEKGILPMPKIAKEIKETIENSFIKNRYKEREIRNGKLNRVIVDSITMMFHSDMYSRGTSLAKYLNDNVTKEEFDTLNKELNILETIVTEETKSLFTVKNSFLLFSLFHKFLNFNIENKKFNDFLVEFKNSLQNKCFEEYENETFNTYEISRNSKDKNVVFAKADMLEKLMTEYFYTGEELEKFVTDVTAVDVDEEKMELFNSMLDDYTVEVDGKSKLLDKFNRPSLLAIVAYSFDKEIELKDWFVDYFNNHNTYLKNQRENYILMKSAVDEMENTTY